MSDKVPIAAVFPAYNRISDSLQTLATIKACNPAPAEIIVHVDGGAHDVARTLAEAHPDVRIMVSEGFVGPGGARNMLVREARHEWVANFDDDSQPDHPDYFARALETAARFPDAAVISAASMEWEKHTPGFMRFGIFSGCGCVYRRSAFLQTAGYVPLRIAYCMEEVDLSLRFHEAGAVIVHDPLLRVNHRKVPPARVSSEVNAHVLANIGLMPLLRYPWPLLPLAFVHIVMRAAQLVRAGYWGALVQGLLMLPGYAARHWHHRAPASFNTLLEWWRLRRDPECLDFREP
ncbi:MAG: glycosyltransferase [Verrucomicrobiaceae bacterium]|nr:glycosyltransferase [Verrucomicrobiaceae bacterium]